MPDLLDRIAAANASPDRLRAHVTVVANVNPDRTVDLDASGSYVAGIPVSAAYPEPAVGDVVMVWSFGGTWHVAYALSFATPPLSITDAPSPDMYAGVGLADTLP